MTIEQILEIVEKYKLRMPPTAFYELKADIVNFEEPTTKNCESCRYYGSHHEVCNYCYECSLWTEQESTTKNNLGVDWEELKSKIFMEVDGGTDDNWLRYREVCDRISNSIDDFKANLPSVTPQELILDKIRAEIKGMTPTYHNPDWSITDLVPISEVLKLVDKYKADRSVEDGNVD